MYVDDFGNIRVSVTRIDHVHDGRRACSMRKDKMIECSDVLCAQKVCDDDWWETEDDYTGQCVSPAVDEHADGATIWRT